MKYSYFNTKRIAIIFAALAFFTFSSFSQTSILERTDFLVTVGPLGILNTQENSAPSPIAFSIGAGAQIELLDQMSITPHAHFFANYYTWKDGQAVPAEIENRSAYVPSIMLDIPATWDIKTGKSIFRLGGGVSFLFRFAFRANHVPETVEADLANINEWFYKGAEFFYPSIQASWDYTLDDGITVGVGAKAYLPVGSLIKGIGLNNGIASIGVRFGI